MASRRSNRPPDVSDPPQAPSDGHAAERCPRCNGLDQVAVVTPKFIMAAWFACPHCNHVWGVPKNE
jgi:hypothetical protein